jgi:nitroreductase
MNTYETICSRRTIREFEDKPVQYELLGKFVNAGRLAPQAANRQPLEFIIVDDAALLEEFFAHTKLAGYTQWKPAIEKMARAYVVILANTEIQLSKWVAFDAALAAENISLAAWDEGIASCLIGAFNNNKIRDLLSVPETYDIPLLIALGHPAHKSFEEEMVDGGVEYWRDEDGNFHVPKRPLKKILHHNKY